MYNVRNKTHNTTPQTEERNMFKTFKITGSKYTTEKTFYDWDESKRYFHYEEIERKELGTFKFQSLKDAEIFLIANYPEYYFGACIKQIDGTDFLINADASYYEIEFQTSDRTKIINTITENLIKRN